MNSQQILDALLNSGKELVEKGVSLAEAKLDIPDDEEARDVMLDGAGKGALAAGALALLLGTGAGRKLTGTALKLGSLAAIGGFAFKAFESFQGQSQSGKIANVQKEGEDDDLRSKALLKAMIAAAKADGHIDEKEKTIIATHAEKLGLDSSVKAFIKGELDKELNVKDVATGAYSPEVAAELYLVSRMILDLDNEVEKTYLDELTSALDLDPEFVAKLEGQVVA
jgi:uncharacterized membrane protein YebE (DUF533 family)